MKASFASSLAMQDGRPVNLSLKSKATPGL